jgi:hypothetical protein
MVGDRGFELIAGVEVEGQGEDGRRVRVRVRVPSIVIASMK